MNKEEILEKIDNDFIKKLMKKYGSDCYLDNGVQLVFKTICHGGDSHKLYYYPNNKLFMCYTNCGGMDIFGLVSKLEDCSYGDAVGIVLGELGLNSQVRRKGFKQTSRLELEEVITPNRDITLPTFDITPVRRFEENTFYKGWIDEGISIETMKKFEILWDGREEGKQIIIPCRDINGNYVGVRRRALLHGLAKYKPLSWMGVNYIVPTSLALYGLYQNQDIIRKLKKAYIFEGEKSVLKCDSYFGNYPAVAVYGSNVSTIQLNMLAELGVQEITLCFDYDGYNKEPKYKKTCKMIRDYGFSAYYLYKGYETELDVHDAPVDQGEYVYKKLLKNRLQ